MKYFIITLAAILFSAATYAQKEKADTLFKATDVGKLIIIDGGDGLTVKAQNDNDSAASFTYHQAYDDNVNVTIKKSEYKGLTNPRCSLANDSISRKWEYYVTVGGLNVGFVSALSTPDGLSIDPFQSAEITLLKAPSIEITQRSGKNAFSIGLGLSWRNYRITDANRFYMNDGQTLVAPYPENVERDWSRLKVFSLSIPMLWRHQFSKNHTMQIGPVLNFNTYSSIKTCYSDGTREVKELQKGQSRVPITLDAYASMTIWGGFGFYVRYSPCNVLKTASGPKMRPLSFGLQLGL